MSSPGMQPEKDPKAAETPTPKRRLGDMPNINSSVEFDASCGVTIDVGTIDSTVTQIGVSWNGSSVYSSSTPNASGQSAIQGGTAIAGSTYTLAVNILYANWTRPSIFTGDFTCRASTSPSQSLARTQTGGT